MSWKIEKIMSQRTAVLKDFRTIKTPMQGTKAITFQPNIPLRLQKCAFKD